MLKKRIIAILYICFFSCIVLLPAHVFAQYSSIKNVNGKFYSYVVLLFNENPHFVNLIQKDNIPLKIIGNEGFHIKAYKNYLKTITHFHLKKMAQKMLEVYLEPSKYTAQQMADIETQLAKWNIILKFSQDKNIGNERITLLYCIYGKKEQVYVKHPLLEIKEKIYNIQPFIYYDEFSTSSSTFYYDMIYIHPDEVTNDYIITSKVIRNIDVKSMFFVGSPVTDDIRYCLKKAFQGKRNVKKDIWKIFIVHELTHKILNNQYNNFNQVTGEELSLSSTIYENPYLGLSIMYSYLNYASINPHRIASMNFLKFVAQKTGSAELVRNPGLFKFFSAQRIQEIAKENFELKLKRLR